uniref:Uncharacterized protein n=1 Tax=Micrurus surinamensis TaxID=129470 RepID=A0A2D4NUA1_MICSU
MDCFRRVLSPRWTLQNRFMKCESKYEINEESWHIIILQKKHVFLMQIDFFLMGYAIFAPLHKPVECRWMLVGRGRISPPPNFLELITAFEYLFYFVNSLSVLTNEVSQVCQMLF